MKRQLPHITIIALGIGLALLELGSVVRAFQGPTPKISEAATRIDKDLDVSFKSKGLNVSSEARAAIRQDILVREASKGTPPAEIKLSPGEAENLSTLLARRNSGSAVDGESARSFLAELKLQTISASVTADVRKEAGSARVTLPTDTQDAIQKDVLQYSKAMARSGLSTDEITAMNRQYLNEVCRQAGSGNTLELHRYFTIKADMFPPVVKLNIVTVPPGATVQVSAGGTDAPIGTSNITEKPFDPNKQYLFLFSLAGYQDSKRLYVVNPYPPTQRLEEVLVKK